MQLDPARLVLEREEDAYALIETMYRKRHSFTFRFRCVKSQTSQRYAVLMDASHPNTPGSRQTFVYSEADWQARLHHMQRWQDLFEPAPSQDASTASNGGEAA